MPKLGGIRHYNNFSPRMFNDNIKKFIMSHYLIINKITGLKVGMFAAEAITLRG